MIQSLFKFKVVTLTFKELKWNGNICNISDDVCPLQAWSYKQKKTKFVENKYSI